MSICRLHVRAIAGYNFDKSAASAASRNYKWIFPIPEIVIRNISPEATQLLLRIVAAEAMRFQDGIDLLPEIHRYSGSTNAQQPLYVKSQKTSCQHLCVLQNSTAVTESHLTSIRKRSEVNQPGWSPSLESGSCAFWRPQLITSSCTANHLFLGTYFHHAS